MTENCHHCGLPILPDSFFSTELEGKTHSFCCLGCQSVSEAIYSAGLQRFYQKTPEDSHLTPPTINEENFSDYDQSEIQADYVTQQGDERTVQLLIDGIHCSACVWLIEHALKQIEGIISAEVNLTSKRLRVTWNSEALNLSLILEQIQQLGYTATPYDLERADRAVSDQHRSLLYRMAFAGFAMMNLLWISIALYSGAAEGEFKNWFYWISFAIATPTLFYSGYPFLRNAVIGLRNGYMTMDLPIAIGASVSYSYSTYVLIGSVAGGEIYFDTVVNFLFVILVGRYLEARSKKNALSSTHRLLALQPKLATLIIDKLTKIVPIHQVKALDKVLVKPGQKVPVDGVVLEGQTTVDESMLTGESTPVLKQYEDEVIAGSINGEGSIVIETRAVLKNTALAKIIELMQDAQAAKSPIQLLADRIVPWFVMTTLLLALLTFVYWNQYDFDKALLAATSVLIITCPCAFGLATPMSIAVATGVSAENGILLRHGAVLEELSQAEHILFDKTATLTEGKLKLSKIERLSKVTETDALMLAASIEKHSEHTIAEAIVNEALERAIDLVEAKNFYSYPGQGVSADIGNKHILIGTEAWLTGENISFNAKVNSLAQLHYKQGESCIFMAVNGVIAAVFTLVDSLRTDAKVTIDSLQRQGLSVSIVSGDNEAVVKEVSNKLNNIPYQAQVLPADKVMAVKKIQAMGKRTVVVGDGVNDAPALMQADIGVAMASGTDVSIESADIVLMHNELTKLVSAQQLAQITMKTIRQNIGLSIGYNVLMVPLAMTGFVTPLMAAITMPISSLLVVANAARIQRLFRG